MRKQRSLRATAVQQLIKGTAKIETKGGQRVINVGKGQYVEYAVKREESIFTILSDFGVASKKGIRAPAGPLNNQIPEPDRPRSPARAPGSASWQPARMLIRCSST